MKIGLIFAYLALMLLSCEKDPAIWEGPELTRSREKLTVEQLFENTSLPLIDMSFLQNPNGQNRLSTIFQEPSI